MPASTRSTASKDASPPPAPVKEPSNSPNSSRQPSPANATTKDQESRERPVRKKFERTHIAAPEDAAQIVTSEEAVEDAGSDAASVGAADEQDDSAQTNGERGRVKKKRSFEEIRGEDPVEGIEGGLSKQQRKRSRDARHVPSMDGDIPPVPSNEAPRATSPEEEGTDSNSTAPTSAGKSYVAERFQTPPKDESASADQALDPPQSPPNKRNRDQFTADQAPSLDQSLAESKPIDHSTEGTPSEATTLKAEIREPESKRPRDRALSPDSKDSETKLSSKTAPSGGFSDTSSRSPFGALAQTHTSKSPPLTSPTKFAASGFASLSSSSQSPFGTLSGQGSSVFGTSAKAEGSNGAQNKTFGSFAGTAASPFATAGNTGLNTSSGFGQLGSSAFGSSSGFGNLGGSGPLKSFASPGKTTPIGGSGKPGGASFGAAAADEEVEGSVGEAEDIETQTDDADADAKDPRFFEQDVETGEENEKNVFSSRGKLYISIDKQWKERGIGAFKLNVTMADENGTAEQDNGRVEITGKVQGARFLMRADGSHRVALNSPLRKEILVSDPAGGPPKGKSVVFLGFVDEKAHLLQLKMRSPDQVQEFYAAVKAVQAKLSLE